MKKLSLVLTTAGLFAVSNAALSSDKALASAFTGVSDSIVRFVKSTTWHEIATPVPAAQAGASGVLVPTGERRALKTVFVLPDFGKKKEADGLSCPVCPDPPCF